MKILCEVSFGLDKFSPAEDHVTDLSSSEYYGFGDIFFKVHICLLIQNRLKLVEMTTNWRRSGASHSPVFSHGCVKPRNLLLRSCHVKFSKVV